MHRKTIENNLSIDIMKKLKSLIDIGNLLASHPIYTYDYSDGLYINSCNGGIQVYSIDLGNDPFASSISGYFIIYSSEETLFENLNENLISHMDLMEGAEDQYYDYSPSQVEAIIFGITKLSPDHQEEILNKLEKHLWEFIQDEEQGEDMVNIYDELYKALVKWEEDHLTPDLIRSLHIFKLFQSLKH